MAMCDPNSVPAGGVHAGERLQRADLRRTQTTDCYAAAVRPSWRCSSIRRGSRRSPTAISCDDTHWCAALTIDSLECTEGFATCNTACEEPVNFACIQRNGVPDGPPSPQDVESGHRDAQLADAADEPGRHDHGPHVRRTCPRRWWGQRLRGRDHGPDNRSDRLHAGLGAKRLREHVDRRLLGHAVQLPARVQHRRQEQHHPVGGAGRPTSRTQYETGHCEPCTSVDRARHLHVLERHRATRSGTSATGRTRARTTDNGARGGLATRSAIRRVTRTGR